MTKCHLNKSYYSMGKQKVHSYCTIGVHFLLPHTVRVRVRTLSGGGCPFCFKIRFSFFLFISTIQIIFRSIHKFITKCLKTQDLLNHAKKDLTLPGIEPGTVCVSV